MVYGKGKYVISPLNSVDKNRGFVLSESIYEVVSASQWRYKSTLISCVFIFKKREKKKALSCRASYYINRYDAFVRESPYRRYR